MIGDPVDTMVRSTVFGPFKIGTNVRVINADLSDASLKMYANDFPPDLPHLQHGGGIVIARYRTQRSNGGHVTVCRLTCRCGVGFDAAEKWLIQNEDSM